MPRLETSLFSRDYQPAVIPFRINHTQWVLPDDYWPRRLLHIDSLTSYERGEDESYNGVKQPRYTILSYTWGRFQDRRPHASKGALPVKGIPWKVPAVRQDHFTVARFMKVLKQMRGYGVDFVWVDIACIDQENDAIKMDEIGHQASIFKRADWAYVWLSHVTNDLCFKALAVMNSVADQIVPQIADEDQVTFLVDSLEEACNILSQDPWFTSLWTLQELMMRNDATILSLEGDLVMDCKTAVLERGKDPFEYLSREHAYDNRPISFTKISSDWSVLEHRLSEVMRHMSSNLAQSQFSQEICKKVKGVLLWMGKTGVCNTNSNLPNIQYGSARHRQTTHPEDRIYGIMQIYDVRVGQSVRSNDRPSLDELIEEFGLTINFRSLMMGQMFVHTSAPKPGRSWCITEHSDVPQSLRQCNNLKAESSVDTSSSGLLQITGPACTLSRFLDVYNKSDPQWEDPIASQLRFYLDTPFAEALGSLNSTEWAIGMSRRTWMSNLRSNIERSWREKRTLIQKLSGLGPYEHLVILRLGNIPGMFCGFGLNDMEEGGSFLLWDNIKPRQHVALVLRKLHQDREECSVSYQRLGVCTWLTNAPLDHYYAFQPQENQEEFAEKLWRIVFSGEPQGFSESMDALFSTCLTVELR